MSSFDQLAEFSRAPFSELKREHGIDSLSNDAFQIEDLFGEAPSHFARVEDDVSWGGDLTIRNVLEDGPRYFLIEGDIDVDGVIDIDISDEPNVLVVTGDLKADALVLLGDSHLYVLGDVQLDGPVVSMLSDGGACIFGGDATASAFVVIGNGELACRGELEAPELTNDALIDKYQDVAVEQVENLIEDIKSGITIVNV